MAKVVAIGSADGRLCGELAAAMALQLTQHDTRPGRKGSTFLDVAAGAFERAEEVLLALGLLQPVAPEQAGPDRVPYAFAMDAREMPDFLARTVPNGDARVARTIEAFVGLACDTGGLTDQRIPFAAPALYLGAMQALTRMGYAERVGDQYRWTDLIGPAMRAGFFWNEQLQSGSTLHLAEEAAEAEAAWRTMPDTIRQTYFSARPVPFIAFARVLSLSWRDGQWHPFKNEDRMDRSGAFALARRIIKYADEGR